MMGTLDPERIGFRRLDVAGLPLMHRWLNTPHVSEWWGTGPSFEEVAHEYGACIRGEDPTEPYLIRYDADPIGYIQTYRLVDHPAYAAAIGVEEDAAGVDLFIGESRYLHRGLGSAILRRFLREVVFAGDAACCVIDPAVGNTVAIRAYEKAGFCYLKTVQVPDEPHLSYLMRIGREEFARVLASAEAERPKPDRTSIKGGTLSKPSRSDWANDRLAQAR